MTRKTLLVLDFSVSPVQKSMLLFSGFGVAAMYSFCGSSSRIVTSGFRLYYTERNGSGEPDARFRAFSLAYKNLKSFFFHREKSDQQTLLLLLLIDYGLRWTFWQYDEAA